MKRLLLIALSCLLMFTLLGCTAKKASAPNMYIEPAQLSKEEQSIVFLVGGSKNDRIFDYKIDDTGMNMSIRVYRLENGAWVYASGGGSMEAETKKGRFALSFDNLADGLRLAIQSSGAVSFQRIAPEKMDTGDMGVLSSVLSNRTELQYDQEIPLAMQVITAKNEVTTYFPESFSDPARLSQHGYEHVYAVTVTFTKNPL